MHRRALLFIPGAKLEPLKVAARDYNSQHRLYPTVLKHSSLCSVSGAGFRFRYWTTKSLDTNTQNVAIHEENGPRYMVSSRFEGSRTTSGDDDRKSAADPDLNLCNLRFDANHRDYIRDLRTVLRMEETPEGVYVETNDVAVIQANWYTLGIADGLVRAAL